MTKEEQDIQEFIDLAKEIVSLARLAGRNGKPAPAAYGEQYAAWLAEHGKTPPTDAEMKVNQVIERAIAEAYESGRKQRYTDAGEGAAK